MSDDLSEFAKGIRGLAAALGQMLPVAEEVERNAAHRLAVALGTEANEASDGSA